MDLNKLLQQQLHAVYDKKDWFVSLIDSLKGLTPQQASQHVAGEEHSIKELVIHIIFWSEWYLLKLQGIHLEPKSESNEYTFTEQSIGTENIFWDELIVKLNKVLSDWVNELSIVDEDKLLTPVSAGRDLWITLISNLILHIAYHTGQIVALRKILGNWDSQNGVS